MDDAPNREIPTPAGDAKANTCARRSEIRTMDRSGYGTFVHAWCMPSESNALEVARTVRCICSISGLVFAKCTIVISGQMAHACMHLLIQFASSSTHMHFGPFFTLCHASPLYVPSPTRIDGSPPPLFATSVVGGGGNFGPTLDVVLRS